MPSPGYRSTNHPFIPSSRLQDIGVGSHPFIPSPGYRSTNHPVSRI
jgi:hypothetical protein